MARAHTPIRQSGKKRLTFLGLPFEDQEHEIFLFPSEFGNIHPV